MGEVKIAEEASVEAPKVDVPAAAPAESPTETKEVIDPRIVAVIGEDKIETAFGEQPKKTSTPVDPVAEEEKKETPPVTEGGSGTEGKDAPKEEPAAGTPQVTPLEAKPSRLDRRLASRYVHNLHLSGETNIPTEEEILADLKKYSKEEKIQALNFHLAKEKELRGENPAGAVLDDEDRAAIAEADREAIRNEVLQEEHERAVQTDFVKFVNEHPELVPGTKEHDPVLEKAVERLTFPKGIEGPMAMPISEAYESVTSQIQAVKDAAVAAEKKEKNAALSGVISGTGQTVPESKELGWDDVARIEKEDPALYRRMVKEGKFKHLM